MDIIIIYCTAPDNDVALAIANHLVNNKLAACVNIVGGLMSVYSWKNEICNDSELLLIIKTKKDLYHEVELSIKALHPYEIPEIIALPIVSVSNDYAGWINSVTK